MTVISKGAVLKKKVGNDVYIYQPYTHIDYVEGGLDQAEIENLINSAGYLDTSAVNAILESYYTKTEVDNKVTTLNNSITTTVNTHNSNTSAHSDIRTLISDLATRLNTLANSDDTTLDQMAEVVAYIKSNRGLIEGITTAKADKEHTHSYSAITGTPTSLPANGGNADTVGGFTVGVNVPANAKFTDTTYSAMSASEATTGTATTARTITAKVLNDKINAIVSANAYSHPTYTAKTSGLYKFVVDETGHISSASAVTKSDITALGIPAQDTTYTLPNASSSTKGGVKIGNNITVSSGTISLTKDNVVSALGYTPPTSDTNTDTKVTNTLNTTAKAYVTGTTSATTNTGTQVFDTGVYLDTVAGGLVAKTFKTASGIEIY